MEDENKSVDDKQSQASADSGIPPQSKQPTIQPSKEFIQELKTTPATPPVASAPTPAPTGPAPNPSPNSIYPDATAGLKITDNLNNENPTKDKEGAKTNKPPTLIIALITIFGAYLAVTALLGLVGSLKLLSFGVVRTSGAVISIIDVVYIIVGLGIILRKEIARVAYIVIAVIGLGLSVYGTVKYFQSLNNVTNAQQQYISSTNAQISGYQNNPAIPSGQKKQITQQLKNDENTQIKLISKEKKDSIAPLIEGYAIAIVPLIFLTRPSVKKEFF